MVTARTSKDIFEDAELAEAVEDLRRVAADGIKGEGIPQDISDPTILVTIYVAETGEPRHVPAWTLEGKNSIMRRRDENGQRVFVTKKPANSPWRQGDVLCLLHRDHPRRAEFEAMGLVGKFCKAAHLGSDFSLNIHMQNRHKQEWATIQTAEQKARDEEYREFQKLQSQAALVAIGAKAETPKKAT